MASRAPSVSMPSGCTAYAGDPPKIRRAAAVTRGRSAAPCRVLTRSIVPPKLPIRSVYVRTKRGSRDDDTTAGAARPEVERAALDAHDTELHPRARRRARVSAGHEGGDLRLRVRLEREPVADPDVELGGQRLADRELVDRRRIRRPAGQHPGPVDDPTEALVQRPAHGQVVVARVLQRELAERRDRSDTLRLTELAELVGGRVTHGDLGLRRPAVLLETPERGRGPARAGYRPQDDGPDQSHEQREHEDASPLTTQGRAGEEPDRRHYRSLVTSITSARDPSERPPLTRCRTPGHRVQVRYPARPWWC